MGLFSSSSRNTTQTWFTTIQDSQNRTATETRVLENVGNTSLQLTLGGSSGRDQLMEAAAAVGLILGGLYLVTR